jgi:hypothetical protein
VLTPFLGPTICQEPALCQALQQAKDPPDDYSRVANISAFLTTYPIIFWLLTRNYYKNLEPTMSQAVCPKCYICTICVFQPS